MLSMLMVLVLVIAAELLVVVVVELVVDVIWIVQLMVMVTSGCLEWSRSIESIVAIG